MGVAGAARLTIIRVITVAIYATIVGQTTAGVSMDTLVVMTAAGAANGVYALNPRPG